VPGRAPRGPTAGDFPRVLGHPLPVLGRALARAFLAVTGWKPEGQAPPGRCVLIAAPHTSNWDFPFTLAFAALFRVRIRWMGKHTLFRPPFGGLLRAMGGIPIQRHLRSNVVAAAAEMLRESDDLVLVVPAEGTRSRTAHWKSGFYHIARSAGVPIVLGYLDYRRKRGGFGPAIVPGDDVVETMDRIRAFYTDKVGKHPERFGPVRLREEAPTDRDAA